VISVKEALQIILTHTQDFGEEEIPFMQSLGRVLKEDVFADRDFPPFDRVAMDGIAINHRFYQYGVRDFKIEGVQAAGMPQEKLDNAACCYEVMTGAVLPENTDTVIRYEDLDINTLMATVKLDEVELGKNIHRKGSDKQQGGLLIAKNRTITASEIGVLATVGKSKVKVAKLPKIMIVSTGDELVDVSMNPEAHQIRRSNVFTLVTLLKKFNIKAETDHIADDKEELKIKIKRLLHEYDVLLFSGAVSKGKFDFLPEVLQELGVNKLFHRVAQRPGKPFWFGVLGSSEKAVERNEDLGNLNKSTSVFAFPGNPVSTFVNCLVYFYPWCIKSLGVELNNETAELAEDVFFKPQLMYFLHVKIKIENGKTIATPVKGNGSGDLISLTEADGFIKLPEGRTEFKKGEVFELIRYR